MIFLLNLCRDVKNICKWLLQEQQTPLHIASRLGNVDIAMLLLQHGADVDAATKDSYTPLHIAAKEGQDEVASVLIEHGASPTATTKRGFTPLHLAAKYGNMKVAKLLIQKDAPVDAQGKVIFFCDCLIHIIYTASLLIFTFF